MATSSDKSSYVMISYQWDAQPRVKELREKLRRAGYNIWIDYERIRGGLVGAMANAVENADTVLVCVSSKYQMSKNCKSEAENAYHLGKRIIPLIFESNFRATDWLGFLVRPLLYFRFDTDELLEDNFPDLLNSLGDSCRIEGTKTEPTVRFGRMKALQCSICLDRFKTPKTLPCLHSFCRLCLLGVAPRGTRSISCPLCREQFRVPDGDANKFPTNFTLRELIEEEAKTEQLFQKDSIFRCTCCDKKATVEGKCESCNQYLCKDGIGAHRQFSAFRAHKVISFDTTEIEPAPVAKRTSPSKPQLELLAADWATFDALYDEEHSIHLFSYWTKLKGEYTWREAMVNHYSTCLEEGVPEQDVISRCMKVARVFKQAGQYSKALELVEKLLNEEEYKGISKTPETKADLYYLGGDIYREMLNAVTYIKDWDPELIKKQIDYARKALEIRRELAEDSKYNQDDNSFEIGRILRLLSGGLRRWWNKNEDTVSGDEARDEGKQVTGESIEIFTRVGARGNAARSMMTKATLEDDGSDEQEKMLNAITYAKDWDPELIKKQIDYARKALEIRRGLAEDSQFNQDDNSFEIGRILQLLSNGLRVWWRKNKDTVSGDEARDEGKKVIGESIEIFIKVGAKGNAAWSILNKANLEDYGSEEQEKLFRQAIKMAHEVYGESSTLCSHLYWNMHVLYERDDYYETYDWLVKAQRIHEKIYGKDHPLNKRVYDKLACEPYSTIKKEKQAE